MRLAAIAILLAAVPACLLPRPALAQYQVLHGHFANGGGVSSGGGYGVFDTAGQPVVGIATGSSNWVKSGFWYCAGITSTVDVAFASFFAELRDDIVVLAWDASVSAPVEGFHVYRSETTEDAFDRITDAPIVAQRGTEYRDESALAGRTYLYRVGALSHDGEWFSPILTVTLPPKPTTLYQNYPNPFNPTTRIAWYLNAASHVNLSIFDVRGARVRTLVDGRLEAGRHAGTWDGRNDEGLRVGSGVYYYRLTAGKNVITKKLVVVR